MVCKSPSECEIAAADFIKKHPVLGTAITTATGAALTAFIVVAVKTGVATHLESVRR